VLAALVIAVVARANGRSFPALVAKHTSPGNGLTKEAPRVAVNAHATHSSSSREQRLASTALRALQRRTDDELPRRADGNDAQPPQHKPQPGQRTEKKMKKKKKDAASPALAEAGAETLRQRRRRRRRPSRANAPHKHNTIKAAARALGAYLRWLGAFRELVTRSNRFKAAAAAVKRFTDAAAAESSGGDGGGGGGNVLAELQQRLDDARWAAATRHRMSRIVARLFDSGVVPGRPDMTPSVAADPAAQ
jgi:hypothetical protein